MDCLSSGFADVDRAHDPSFFSSCLATLNTLPYFQDYKTKSFSLMDVREGSRVLEVGCGLGYDALAREDGLREILGASIAESEDSGIWLTLFRSLKDRGLDWIAFRTRTNRRSPIS